MASTARDKASLALAFVLQHLERIRDLRPRRPLFVACQGPQGCGKSHLAAALARSLTAPPHRLRVASLSLDDLYLPHDALTRLASSHPENGLLAGRGQPGTHDVDLGARLLHQLRADHGTVHLPVYDKSAHSGEGDRSDETVEVECPLDVVIFEGWMTCFLPLEPSALVQRYSDLPPTARAKQHTFKSVETVNELLRPYAKDLWPLCDLMVQLKPLEPSYPWTWRLQQEHAMKAKNGGIGMTDDQVKAFVDRYAPAYELWDFADRPRHHDQPWQQHLLTLTLDMDRNVIP